MNKKFMRLAVQEARKNLKSLDGGPFGACIVRGNQVLAVARNTVLKSDATAHAEINAIRIASRKIKNYDLSGATIYSTTEPCPMCFSALHWARVDRIIYGTTIRDAARAGFNELRLGNAELKRRGKSSVKLVAGFMRAECGELMEDWGRSPGRKVY